MDASVLADFKRSTKFASVLTKLVCLPDIPVHLSSAMKAHLNFHVFKHRPSHAVTNNYAWLGLPRECIHIVASYLDHLALHAMEMTCRTFYESGIHGGNDSCSRDPSQGDCDMIIAFSSVDRPREEGAKNTLRVSRCFRRMRARSDDGPQQALLNYTLQTYGGLAFRAIVLTVVCTSLICGCSQGDCYWSSAPSASEIQDDYIDYTLVDRCIIRAIDIVPYKAFWQMGEPGYAPMKVSISFFTPGDSSNADRCMLEPPLTAKNYLLHKLYLRQEYAECLKLIEEMLKEHQGLCEYPIYVKGTRIAWIVQWRDNTMRVALIMQRSGRIQESLQLFQAATCLNPDNKDNLKQVGRSLYLLGKHKAAIEVYEETKKLDGPDDWEIHHNIGLCHMYLKSYDLAIESFQNANNIHRHDTTFLQLGKVHTLREDFKAAINVYLEALEFSPENPELLTTVGLLYLRIGENFRAFDYLGNSMTHDPRNAKAVASLKRALYLDPFEWITSYNLGLVHLNTGQYASAFHYFSAAINLKPDFPSSYMYLAITLGRLDDFENACSALVCSDHLFHLNYAVTLFNNDEIERAKVQFDKFDAIFQSLDEATQSSDPEVISQRQALLEALNE
ncbi:hypothetical protein DYB32_003411 [Aphanomyces invadans]|uniref:Uncharacterized protein n=1 Tax=Aphanomyces invadans TaxID=157072 RepID=A0A418B0K7_9STRA|nr:hypothetical protein DYB32_003411 [Aphanomyces invadans]